MLHGEKCVRILLVEDSQRLQRALSNGLRREGCAVDIAGDGSSGLWHATHHPYDVIILDLMLPGIDGIELLHRLRQSDPQHGADAHVLVLTARDTVADRVCGLRAGADDYLVKPFAFEELLARIQALTRRRHNVKKPVITIDDLSIDTTARSVSRDGQAIELAAREYSLLEFLALRMGHVVSRSDIEAHLYDEQTDVMSNVIDAAVYALRKKIDAPGRPSLIQTRRGMGYMLQPAGAGGRL
jgi:DNA-binding response OmpR family regulator